MKNIITDGDFLILKKYIDSKDYDVMKYAYQKDVENVYHQLTKEQQKNLHSQIKDGDQIARKKVIHSCLNITLIDLLLF